jgi:3-hydroxyisobutyrate dehydrogenase-like beta-hydroxyacid dehydrogenase
MPERLVVAVLGLGEAGEAFARGLLAEGILVRGYDPALAAPEGVTDCASEAEAVTGADLVLSMNSSSAAVEALSNGIRSVGRGAVWADLNTASPGTKRKLAALAAERSVPFTDIAIMAPVPPRGLRTPLLASGEAAERAASLLRGVGASVDVLTGPAGMAASRKLLRSVFFKGLAAAVVEALEAASAAGCEDWLRDNIVDELDRADSSTVDRLVRGSHRHAVRRTAEMAAATQMLTELGVPPSIAAASRDLLARLSAEDSAR